jgi:hypothetical protein
MADYDIIGDIHGHAGPLVALLQKLGYSQDGNGVYGQDGRQVIFLGDFIDRGPQQKQVIDIVRPMVESHTALAVMGNHEFNAISYHSKNTNHGEYLRAHSEKNTDQHRAFLDAYPLAGDAYPLAGTETREVIDWFKTLPLYLDLDEIRIIHACWDDQTIEDIKQYATVRSDDFWVKANQSGLPEYEAIERLLKGPEIRLPDGISFKDKDQNERHHVRIKWWLNHPKTYRDYAFMPGKTDFPDLKLTREALKIGYPSTGKPVFIGHYWLTGTPVTQCENIACLDYSIAGGGKLVAYQWNAGEGQLRDENFVFVE